MSFAFALLPLSASNNPGALLRVESQAKPLSSVASGDASLQNPWAYHTTATTVRQAARQSYEELSNETWEFSPRMSWDDD